MIEKSFREMALFRGILLVLLGVFILAWPALTLGAALLIFGIYLVVLGIVEIVSGIVSIFHWYGVPEIILGVLALILGLVIVRHPGVTLLAYIYLIGIWFILRGIAYLFYDKIAGSRGLSIFLGIIAVILGILLVMKPVAAGAAFYWAVGLYALVAGATWIAAAFFLRKKEKD